MVDAIYAEKKKLHLYLKVDIEINPYYDDRY